MKKLAFALLTVFLAAMLITLILTVDKEGKTPYFSVHRWTDTSGQGWYRYSIENPSWYACLIRISASGQEVTNFIAFAAGSTIADVPETSIAPNSIIGIGQLESHTTLLSRTLEVTGLRLKRSSHFLKSSKTFILREKGVGALQ